MGGALIGGLFVLLFINEPLDPVNGRVWGCFTLTALISLALGVYLFKRDKKQFVFVTVLFFLLLFSTLLVSNIVASFISPKWPAQGLHGVSPRIGEKTWGRVGERQKARGFNSWGQRDKERSLLPRPGVIRLAFVGDSFLEESTSTPLSLRVEEKINQANVEVLNLGVSDSAPDEYFYRLKNIALLLKVNHCFLFLYAGNDFIQSPTLSSLWGILAVSPKESLFSILGLSALNHVLFNHERPLMKSWFKAGGLLAQESKRASELSGSDEKIFENLLLWVDEKRRESLKKNLSRKNLRVLFQAFRKPDQGLFRSYLIEAAIKRAAGQRTDYEHVSETYAYKWVQQAARLCQMKGVGFTLVVFPEAFQVDSRMQKLYSPLADMKRFYQAKQEAANRILAQAKQDGLDCIDLFPVLKDQPGMYLNLDGHWSDEGVERLSDFMAQEIKRRVAH